ncbi:hypothetical protein FQR65_LT18711 [Abscondita terminalis]|nr:hypothetical protein FQR65_LT18711 [Abscondita terminalis]
MNNKQTENARPRSNSTGRITEFLKRKRIEDNLAAEAESSVQKNKKVNCALTNSKSNKNCEAQNLEMEEVLKAIENLRKETKQGFEENKQEILQLKQEMKLKQEEWDNEKKILTQKIEKLENYVELQNKLKKKKSIIIKGIPIDDGHLTENVNRFIESKMGLKVTATEAFKIGKHPKRNLIRDFVFSPLHVISEINTKETKLSVSRPDLFNVVAYQSFDVPSVYRQVVDHDVPRAATFIRFATGFVLTSRLRATWYGTRYGS